MTAVVGHVAKGHHRDLNLFHYMHKSYS